MRQILPEDIRPVIPSFDSVEDLHRWLVKHREIIDARRATAAVEFEEFAKSEGYDGWVQDQDPMAHWEDWLVSGDPDPFWSMDNWEASYYRHRLTGVFLETGPHAGGPAENVWELSADASFPSTRFAYSLPEEPFLVTHWTPTMYRHDTPPPPEV